MARKKAGPPGHHSDGADGIRTLPLSRLASNRDKALRKARDLFNDGKLDEARKAFERAEYWQGQIDRPG